jgi:hypothetical protein
MVNNTERRPTRRTGVRMLCIGGACAALELGSSRQIVAAAEPRATAFALVGDRSHPANYIYTALSRTLIQEAGLSIDFRIDLTDLSAEQLKGHRMLIIFRDGMIHPNGYDMGERSTEKEPGPKFVSLPPLPQADQKSASWITPAQGKAVRDFVEAGGSALLYHNTNNISLYNADFRDVQGGVYEGHPPLRPFKVTITNRDHPITRGVNDFVVTDEQHYMKYEKDPKYVFMRSVNEDGLTYRDLGSSAMAGWAYDYGKGRVCFLAPGHRISVLWNPEYVKLQHNAVRWLLREL